MLTYQKWNPKGRTIFKEIIKISIPGLKKDERTWAERIVSQIREVNRSDGASGSLRTSKKKRKSEERPTKGQEFDWHQIS